MIRLVALLACLWPALATAQSWPVYENIYVNDYARVLPEDVETRIKRQLETLRDETGVEATVLTLNTRGGFTPSDTMEEFATGLFNAWGIGDAARNDGILILVLRDDRQMRIELGSGYGRAFNREAQDIIDRVFLPEFRNDDYADGIEDGTDAVIERIARVHWNGEQPPERASDDDGGVLGWVLGTLAVLGGIAAAFSRKIIDRFRTCPDCGERGMHTTRHRLRAPTRSRTGSGEKITDCPHCGYHAVVPYTIPMITSSSSSSSGGSFGGGSSSGGGASGSW